MATEHLLGSSLVSFASHFLSTIATQNDENDTQSKIRR